MFRLSFYFIVIISLITTASLFSQGAVDSGSQKKDMANEIDSYSSLENSNNLWHLGAGATTFVYGAYNFSSKNDYWKGASYPLMIGGLYEIWRGRDYFLGTDRTASTKDKMEKDPAKFRQEEIERLKSEKRFSSTSRNVYIALFATGIILYKIGETSYNSTSPILGYRFGSGPGLTLRENYDMHLYLTTLSVRKPMNDATLIGFGAGLAFQSALMYALDYFLESRLSKYSDRVINFNVAYIPTSYEKSMIMGVSWRF